MVTDTSFDKKRTGPRVIKKHRESPYTDINSPWYRITAGLGALAIYPAYRLLNFENPPELQYALVAWSVSAALIWYDYCGMDPLKARKNWDHFWFEVDDVLGRHYFNRITTGASWFERLLGRKLSVIYPVKVIYSDGLTQFDDDQWAYYVELKIKRRRVKNKKLSPMYMAEVINAMFNYQIVKFVTMRKKNPRKEVINYLLKMSHKVTDKLRAQHINSLIQMKLESTTAKPKVTRHILMIGIGEHKTYESALAAKRSIVPGMLKKLKRADFKPDPFKNSRKVEMLLRENIGETAVL